MNLVELCREFLRVAVGRFSIRDVKDGRRIAVRMGIAPSDKLLCGLRSRLAHGRSAGCMSLKPDRELNRLLDDAGSAVVYLLWTSLDAQRGRFDGRDWIKNGRSQRALKTVVGPIATVSNNTDG